MLGHPIKVPPRVSQDGRDSWPQCSPVRTRFRSWVPRLAAALGSMRRPYHRLGTRVQTLTSSGGIIEVTLRTNTERYRQESFSDLQAALDPIGQSD